MAPHKRWKWKEMPCTSVMVWLGTAVDKFTIPSVGWLC
jgi:hypothetical protein